MGNAAPKGVLEPSSGEQSASSADAEPPVRGRRLSTYLVLLGITIAVPALVFCGYLVVRFTEIQRESTRLVTRETANSISHAIDREITGMITTLKVLASAPALESGDFADFHARTRAALQGTASHILLLDDGFQQLLNTRVPYGTPLGHTSDPESAAEALRIGRPYISDLFFGAVAEQQVVNVLVPVELPGGTRYVLIMTRNAETLAPIISEQQLPPSWAATLIDGENKIIVGSSGQRTGDPGPFSAYSGSAGQSVSPTTVRLGDDRVVFAIRASYITGWRVIAWVPASVIERPLWSSWSLLVLAGVVLLILTALLAYWSAHRVAGPILALAGHARALGQGETVEVLASPFLEINEVSHMLAKASSERRDAEDRIRFLVRELSHRAKNQLAVVMAMARQTASNSESLEEFQTAFSERVQGLARSTDLLVHQEWQGVQLEELVKAYLAPFDTVDPTQIVIDGPLLQVGPNAAQHLGLALHELATNASKYGALSTSGGSITIRWHVDRSEPSRFRMSWAESGGPPVEPPARTGFGSMVIRTIVARSLDGEVTHEFRPEGVFWSLDTPCDAVLRRNAHAGRSVEASSLLADGQ